MSWLLAFSFILVGEKIFENEYFSHNVSEVWEQKDNLPVELEDVEVLSRRGAARVMPEREVSASDIDAMGTWDIRGVLTKLEEEMGINEHPVVIVNGRLVANSTIYFDFPPDALVRVEVLPIEAASIYNGSPSQRVVNIVLQPNFSSYDARSVGTRPTNGRTASLLAEVRQSAITGDNTHLVSFHVSHEAPLRAVDREYDILSNVPEAGAVTLRPLRDLVSANGTLTRPFGRWSSVFSLSGLAGDTCSVVRFNGDLVENCRRNDSLSGSAGLSGYWAGWNLQINLNGQTSRSHDEGVRDTRNESQIMGLNASIGRTFIELPAGFIVANISGNLMENRSVVNIGQDLTFTRFQSQEMRGTLTIPLSKFNTETLSGRLIGDLQATLGGGVRESSGGGGAGVNGALVWAPRKGLRLNGSWSSSSDSVSELSRSEPIYYGAPRIVFDFQAGEAVEIVPILGGNPNLRPPRSERLSLAASAGPFTSWGVSGNLGYQRTESTNGIGLLPDLTEDVEIAFPDRFQRDVNGHLISIDYRPLNLSSSLTESLTTILNFNLPRPAGVAVNEAMVLRFSLNYNLQLRNMVTLLEGRPDLDRLRGDGGGISKQSIRVMLDARQGRWGLNASARWQDGYRTRRNSGWDDPLDLVQKPFAAVDMKLSFQMMSSSIRGAASGEEGGPRRRSSGLQVNLEVENLFDARPEARLGDGAPAPGYGRDAQDPVGRTVRFTLQRRF